MPWTREARLAGPRPWLVVLLAGIYLMAGLTGHDPWKSEDAIHLSIAHGFATAKAWLPNVAGEPLPDVEPLYHWLAAGTAWLTQSLLPFHDGARLASAVFGALFLALLAGAARQLHGREAGLGAPLLAIGTLGLVVPLHEAQPAAAVLAAAAAAYWGAALLATRPLIGTMALGLAVGGSLPAGGLNAALPLAPLLLVPLAQRRWASFLVAAVVATAVAAAWPMLLARQAPSFLDAWWTFEVTAIAPHGPGLDHWKLLAWFGWPVLYLALWALWGERRWSSLPFALPLFGTLLAASWFLSHDAKPATALGLLPPLILLAAAGTERLRRGAANALDWFGMMTFSLVAALIWLGSVAMLTGWPSRIAHNFAKLEPGFAAKLSIPSLLAALAITLLWLAMLLRLPRSPWRAVCRWAAGLTVVWALLMALWLPWIDYGKTYRPVALALRAALPDNPGCIARYNLGLPQRASLDYFAGIRTRSSANGCRWLIAQGGTQAATPAGWSKVWEGHRPGDRSERLRLFRREN